MKGLKEKMKYQSLYNEVVARCIMLHEKGDCTYTESLEMAIVALAESREIYFKELNRMVGKYGILK